ncbi:exodeoxyribonuclease VIII-like protein [Pectobacteriaceae bacterium C52]|nr:exodeoxyribonuclease VIII-like protein [Pectobacteriaceae bacterium C52]
MAIYQLVYEPKKSAQKNGAVALAIAKEAKTQKLAIMAATMQLEEEFPGASDNFFNPKVTEDAIGSPRSALNKFDEQFPIENELVNGVWRRIEAPATQANDAVDFSTLSFREKIAAIALYDQTEINEHEFSMVCDYLDMPTSEGDENTNIIINVLGGIQSLEHVSDNLLLTVINGINARFPSLSDAPEREILAFVDKQIKVVSGDKAESKPKIKGLELKRQYTHTYATLDKEIAAALVCDPEDCWELTTEQVRASSVLMNNEDEAFKRWSMELRTNSKALEIPRPIIFALIKSSKRQPELLKDANARHQFVVDFLAEHMPVEPIVTSAGEKTEVASATDQQKSETPVAETVKPTQSGGIAHDPSISDSTARQAKEALAQLGYSVYSTQPDDGDRTIEKTEGYSAISVDDFQQRAAVMEAEIESKPADAQENLSIWKRVQRTDSKYTKALSGAGFDGTSINSEYMIMRATEIFGPVGTGWGYHVIEEKMIPGAPLSEALYDDNKKFIGTRLLRDADGSLISELNHSLKILFWYVTHMDKRAEVESYGATPYLMKTKNGIKADSEVVKKSLTDAIKKALSLLGFSADVWLGMHDNPEYLADNKVEFDIKNASDKASDVVRLRAELDEKLSRVANTLENSVSQNEATKVYSTIAREVEVHRKNAEAKGDTEHAKYLAGRLRRLNKIKEERIAALKANEGETA